MRRFLLVPVALAFLVVPTIPSRAADDELLAIIDKAIKAVGADQLSEKTGQFKTKGTLDLMGNSVPVTQEVSFLLPDKFKEAMELDIAGQKINVVTIYDGKQAWITAQGNTQEVKDKLLEEMKEAAHLIEVSRLLKLKDKNLYTLSALGEAQVNDKPAIGIKVSAKGFRDANVYFDKQTGLPAKVERTALDFMTQQEVNEERIMLEYMDVEGHKVPKKILVNRNGKKLLEAEVTDYKFSPKLEASDFAKP